MIKGVTVIVLHPVIVGVDSFNNYRYGTPVREVVENVLVAPSTTMDGDAARPHGYVTTLTLHFPKGYAGDLYGCKVELPSPYPPVVRVVGAPVPYIEANVPTLVPWSMSVTVEDANG